MASLSGPQPSDALAIPSPHPEYTEFLRAGTTVFGQLDTPENQAAFLEQFPELKGRLEGVIKLREKVLGMLALLPDEFKNPAWDWSIKLQPADIPRESSNPGNTPFTVYIPALEAHQDEVRRCLALADQVDRLPAIKAAVELRFQEVGAYYEQERVRLREKVKTLDQVKEIPEFDGKTPPTIADFKESITPLRALLLLEKGYPLKISKKEFERALSKIQGDLERLHEAQKTMEIIQALEENPTAINLEAILKKESLQSMAPSRMKPESVSLKAIFYHDPIEIAKEKVLEIATAAAATRAQEKKESFGRLIEMRQENTRSKLKRWAPWVATAGLALGSAGLYNVIQRQAEAESEETEKESELSNKELAELVNTLQELGEAALNDSDLRADYEEFGKIDRLYNTVQEGFNESLAAQRLGISVQKINFTLDFAPDKSSYVMTMDAPIYKKKLESSLPVYEIKVKVGPVDLRGREVENHAARFTDYWAMRILRGMFYNATMKGKPEEVHDMNSAFYGEIASAFVLAYEKNKERVGGDFSIESVGNFTLEGDRLSVNVAFVGKTVDPYTVQYTIPFSPRPHAGLTPYPELEPLPDDIRDRADVLIQAAAAETIRRMRTAGAPLPENEGGVTMDVYAAEISFWVNSALRKQKSTLDRLRCVDLQMKTIDNMVVMTLVLQQGQEMYDHTVLTPIY